MVCFTSGEFRDLALAGHFKCIWINWAVCFNFYGSHFSMRSSFSKGHLRNRGKQRNHAFRSAFRPQLSPYVDASDPVVQPFGQVGCDGSNKCIATNKVFLDLLEISAGVVYQHSIAPNRVQAGGVFSCCFPVFWWLFSATCTG